MYFYFLVLSYIWFVHEVFFCLCNDVVLLLYLDASGFSFVFAFPHVIGLYLSLLSLCIIFKSYKYFPYYHYSSSIFLCFLLCYRVYSCMLLPSINSYLLPSVPGFTSCFGFHLKFCVTFVILDFQQPQWRSRVHPLLNTLNSCTSLCPKKVHLFIHILNVFSCFQCTVVIK